MAPQLQINQGPQDALLFDNTRSYFTNVGYVRTSNFQMELRDIDPQNTANLGATVNFVVPKAADLLGPVDLMIEFEKAAAAPGSSGAGKYWGWVESVGLAMIDKITFSVGSHDVETLTGEHLNIMNELMRSDTARYGFHQTLKTGRSLVRAQANNGSYTVFWDSDKSADTCDRLIAYDDVVKEGKKLVVPLGLFFTTHPSKYFPLAAIAGCNDVRISIKFKTIDELVMCHGKYTVASGANKVTATTAAADAELSSLTFSNGKALKSCVLRCHYIHVTGPEATALMNREHVRLMKLWHGNQVTKQFQINCKAADSTTGAGEPGVLDIDLSFLHPVQELIITIRKVSDMGSQKANQIAPGAAASSGKIAANTAMVKNYFAYHGGGKEPNVEAYEKYVEESDTNGTDVAKSTFLKTKSFTLKLNGQTRHLDGKGIDRDYLMNRLMPMLHSNTSNDYELVSATSLHKGVGTYDSATAPSPLSDLEMLSQLKDRKEIYVYPFALNPEGANPSGSVNFSKVSHAKLSIAVEGFAPSSSSTISDDFQVDVYGVYYNWLAIKDGRALTSFA